MWSQNGGKVCWKCKKFHFLWKISGSLERSQTNNYIKGFPYLSGRNCSDSCRKITTLSWLSLPEKWVQYSRHYPKTLKYPVFCIDVEWGQSYLMGRKCLFSLGCHPSSNGVTIKIPYGVDVLLH